MGTSNRLPNSRLIFSSLLVSFATTFHFGYQLLIPNPAETAFQTFVNSSMYDMGMKPNWSQVELAWGIIVALLFIGSVLGALISKLFIDNISRKYTVMACSIGMIISAGVSLLSYKVNSFILFAIGRFLIAFFLGPTYSLAPMYMTECSPKNCRGFVNMTMGLMVVSGTLAGAIIAMQEIFGTVEKWWLIYIFEIGALLISLVLMLFIYESPIYLLKKDRVSEAKKSIQFYYNIDEIEVEKVLNSMKEVAISHKKSIAMHQFNRDRITLRGTILGSMIGFIVGMSGVDVLNSFAVNIMVDSGLSKLVASLAQAGINSVSVIAIICSSFIVDRVGRRPFLLISLLVIIICDIIYAGLLEAYKYYQSKTIGILLVVTNAIFSFFFGLGPQALSFFVPSEMVAEDAKSTVQNYASVFSMGSGAVAVGLFVPLKNWITSSWAYFILFAIPCIIFEIIFYFMIPETKNRDFHEVVEEIEKLPTLYGFCRKNRGEAQRNLNLSMQDSSENMTIASNA